MTWKRKRTRSVGAGLRMTSTQNERESFTTWLGAAMSGVTSVVIPRA